MTTKAAKPSDEPRPRLGRGLAALYGGTETHQPPPQPQSASSLPPRWPKKVPIEHMGPNPRNPRNTFDPALLEELTLSIKEKGILQPLLVRPVPGHPDHFEIIAGERRWRAAQYAGLYEVPVHVVEANDSEALELAIIENIQRADLNPLEEAAGYERLLDEFNYSQVELAKELGKSRSHIANSLRLLKLPEPVKALLANGEISAGHARALLNAEDPEALAQAIIAKGLSVRQAEAWPSGKPQGKGQGKGKENGKQDSRDEPHAKPAEPTPQVKSPDVRMFEKTLIDALGLDVSIKHGQGEAGELIIGYRTFDELEMVAKMLGWER
ncbi:MAG TPA: ParB/RepB/Spo0J family partition protein [Methylocella sp.]|nr:ParB/RepB/Spo0J family partition protein [Methylocella sp.]